MKRFILITRIRWRNRARVQHHSGSIWTECEVNLIYKPVAGRFTAWARTCARCVGPHSGSNSSVIIGISSSSSSNTTKQRRARAPNIHICELTDDSARSARAVREECSALVALLCTMSYNMDTLSVRLRWQKLQRTATISSIITSPRVCLCAFGLAAIRSEHSGRPLWPWIAPLYSRTWVAAAEETDIPLSVINVMTIIIIIGRCDQNRTHEWILAAEHHDNHQNER